MALLLPAAALSALSGRAAPLPVYSSVTLEVSTGSDWTTVGLVGGDVVDANVTSRSFDARPSLGSSGIGLGDDHPSSRSGANTLPPAQVTVNLVYSVLPGQGVMFQICKGDLGTVNATVTHNQGQDHTPVASLHDASSGQDQSSNGCQNGTSVPITQQALTGTGSWPAPIDTHRHVLAIYYPWYDASSFRTGTWAEIPRRPFDTSNAANIRAQIDEARASHVDGFVVSYDGNRTYAQRLAMVAREAATRPGFYVAPMLEMNQLATRSVPTKLVPEIARQIEAAVAETAGPSQLQVAGRPVVFVFASGDLSPATWKQVFLRLKPQPFFVADARSPAYGFQGLFDYTSNFASDDQMADLARGFEKLARWDPAVNGGSQRLWVAAVSPGENGCVSPVSDRVHVGREAGARYAYAWQAAMTSEPEWVLISTWNEWYEDTAIAPGSRNGLRALRQTRMFARDFEMHPAVLPASTYPPPASGNTNQACP